MPGIGYAIALKLPRKAVAVTDELKVIGTVVLIPLIAVLFQTIAAP